MLIGNLTFLPIIGLVAIVLFLRFAMPGLIRRAALASVRKQARVLADAAVVVGQVAYTEAPDDEAIREAIRSGYGWDVFAIDHNDQPNTDSDTPQQAGDQAAPIEEPDVFADEQERAEFKQIIQEAVDSYSGRTWYSIVLTIEPKPYPGGRWEPGNLRLVRPEYDCSSLAEGEVPAPCLIHRLEIEEDGGYVDCPTPGMRQEPRFAGPLTLRMWIGVLPGIQTLKCEYLFEGFGEIDVTPAVRRS